MTDRLPHDLLADAGLDEVDRGILTSALLELRLEATTADVAPQGILTAVLDEGLGAVPVAAEAGILTFSPKTAQQGILTASTDQGILQRGILTMQVRGRTLGRVLTTKVAAVGMMSKAAAAGAAVTVASAGAGVGGSLPAPAQVAFDDMLGRDVVVTEVVDDVDAGVLGDDVSDGSGVTGATEGGSNFGRVVAADATGESDGVAGVDGREVATEASDGRAGGTASGAVRGDDERDEDEAADDADDAAEEAAEAAEEAADDEPETAEDSDEADAGDETDESDEADADDTDEGADADEDEDEDEGDAAETKADDDTAAEPREKKDRPTANNLGKSVGNVTSDLLDGQA